MPISHSPHAPTNPYDPQPTGYCDRCSFLYPLSALTEQRQWAGPAVIGLGHRMCPRCLDNLQENGFRTIVIGPDPKPLKDARPGAIPHQAPVPVQFVLDDPDADVLDTGDYLG
jgi:hypothetical protein